MSLYIPDRP